MGQSLTRLHYHLVFATRKRLPILCEEHEVDLFNYICRVVEKRKGRVLAVNGVTDHIHLLLHIPATCTVATMVAAIKANSSSYAKQLLSEPGFYWQKGYACFSVSESQIDRVKTYIQRQKQHHQRFGFAEEMTSLLGRHGLSGAVSEFVKAVDEEPDLRGSSPHR